MKESRLSQSAKSKLDAKARELLRDSLFLHKAIEKVGALGVVGEKRNRGVLVLAGMSKALLEPVSVLLKGPSSSGKSYVVERTLLLFPPSCIVGRAGLSSKALAHGKFSLKHKILFMYELRSAKEAQLLLRLLQSGGKIEYEFVTVRGAERGTKTTKRIGMPVVLSTTTEETIFEDDETRFLSLMVDKSPKQTRAVLLSRARKPQKPDTSDLAVWQRAMSMIVSKKGDFEHPPKWLQYVGAKVPTDGPRVRRDWDRFLKFCDTIALWRSFGEKGPVDISFKDYCIAYSILEPVFVSARKHLQSSGPHRVVANVVDKLYKRFRKPVTVREIVKELGFKKQVVYKHLKRAMKDHLVEYRGGTRERNLKLVIPVHQPPASRFLSSPKSVLKHHPELGNKVKYTDPLTGEREVIRL